MRITDSEPVFSIGSAARKLQIAIPTLRLYEKEGLICPMRTSTHRRLYSLNDLRIVETAQHLIHEDGLNFAGIRRLMAFLPCWKIRGCEPNLYPACKVPCATDSPCWSSGLALWRKCDGDCQTCPVYKMASQIGDLSILDLISA
ncbi:MAG: MerR family transcriptional regulator [Proteobacteria bacterium]|nr:MerR family transcriptional regulator [Pseudomonadota bacterium]NIS70013.1 MerR family transcriptional regulator [Pseudomonadota bacterium]